MMVTSFQNQAAQRPQAVTQHSPQACGRSIQRNRVSGAQYMRRNAGHILFRDSVFSPQSSVAGEKQVAGSAVFSNQSVEDRAPVYEVQKDCAAPEFSWVQRTDLHRITIADYRVHTRSACFETDGGVLLKQTQNNVRCRRLSGMVFGRHRGGF